MKSRKQLRIGCIPSARCFKCECSLRYKRRPRQCILRNDKIISVPLGHKQRRYQEWIAPSGLVFEGGGNYGSTLYDSMMDGVGVELLVCDDCLKKYRRFLRHTYDEERTLRYYNAVQNGKAKKREEVKQKPHIKKLLAFVARQHGIKK